MSESLRWSPLALDDGEHVVLGDAYFMTHGTCIQVSPTLQAYALFICIASTTVKVLLLLWTHGNSKMYVLWWYHSMFPKGKPNIHIQTNEKYMYCQQSYNMSFPNVRQSKHLFSNIFLNYKKDNVCSSTFAHTGLIKKVWPGVFRGQ